jgi:hypothetical protein
LNAGAFILVVSMFRDVSRKGVERFRAFVHKRLSAKFDFNKPKLLLAMQLRSVVWRRFVR